MLEEGIEEFAHVWQEDRNEGFIVFVGETVWTLGFTRWQRFDGGSKFLIGDGCIKVGLLNHDNIRPEMPDLPKCQMSLPI